jgi:hypothetical protein
VCSCDSQQCVFFVLTWTYLFRTAVFATTLTVRSALGGISPLTDAFRSNPNPNINMFTFSAQVYCWGMLSSIFGRTVEFNQPSTTSVHLSKPSVVLVGGSRLLFGFWDEHTLFTVAEARRLRCFGSGVGSQCGRCWLGRCYILGFVFSSFAALLHLMIFGCCATLPWRKVPYGCTAVLSR